MNLAANLRTLGELHPYTLAPAVNLAEHVAERGHCRARMIDINVFAEDGRRDKLLQVCSFFASEPIRASTCTVVQKCAVPYVTCPNIRPNTVHRRAPLLEMT